MLLVQRARSLPAAGNLGAIAANVTLGEHAGSVDRRGGSVRISPPLPTDEWSDVLSRGEYESGHEDSERCADRS